MIVRRAVSALVAAAHLANVEHVELERLDDRLVEPLGGVVVVDPDGQVSRHVGHGVPALESELDARRIGVEGVEVEHDLVVEELGSAQVAHASRQNVLVEHLLLHEIAGRHGDVEHRHAGGVGLALVHPARADVVRDVRVVAPGEAQSRQERERADRRLRDEAVHVHVVLQRELGDRVAGAARLDLHRAPRVRDVQELRRGEVVLRDEHRLLHLRVRRGFDVQREGGHFADSMPDGVLDQSLLHIRILNNIPCFDVPCGETIPEWQ